jgi:ADP-ribose pyrophosphatase YjhB (NUDIX family)
MEKGIFNIRAYAIIINNKKEVLLSDEHRFGKSFTKFPGGGLEFGEGIKDCLFREIKEELNLEIKSYQHFYTTEFFQLSAFHQNQQIISIYYKVELFEYAKIETENKPFNFKNGLQEDAQIFRWKALNYLSSEDLTFPIDKHVVELLLHKNSTIYK